MCCFLFFFVIRCSWTVTGMFLVTSGSGAWMICNHWVWYSHNIPPIIKMLNENMTQGGTQATGLGVIIGRCSSDSQYGRADRHPANVGCSFFKYMNDDLRNNNNQRRKRKTWTRNNSQLALHCYSRSNASQRGYRKRMIEIWQEFASFRTSSQIFADQIRTIVKKKRFVFWP